ncbi:MAG: RHS repeat-associated core domain-containing protein [Alphaproteobacteria bacterium]
MLVSMKHLLAGLAIILALAGISTTVAAQQSLAPLGPGSACWWGQVWPPQQLINGNWVTPVFPSGQYKRGCVATDPATAADCWLDVNWPINPPPGSSPGYYIATGMSCRGYPNPSANQPLWCYTGGLSYWPSIPCGVPSPGQCTNTPPVDLLVLAQGAPPDENCTTVCSTGYLDKNGNCATPPAKKFKKKEPLTDDCNPCDVTGNHAEYPLGEARALKGMSVAQVFPMHVSLNVRDIPVGYQPPLGPGAYIRLSYNQKDSGQPATFSYYNVGSKWTLNTLSFITDDPAAAGTGVKRYVAGGGAIDYDISYTYNTTTGAFKTERSSKAGLVRVPASGAATSYELRFPSGTKHIYGLFESATTAPRRVFLTEIVDPQGLKLTFNYDAQFRLTSVTDAAGRNTTLSYTDADPKKVTRVTDPFGRFSTLTYNAAGQLASITDVAGIVSSFGYSTAFGGYLNSLTTPYGTTNFSYYETTVTAGLETQDYQALEQTNPLGQTRRTVFREQSSLAVAPTLIPTGTTAAGDYSRDNTFIWDEYAYPQAITKDAGGNVTAEDTSKAHLIHWLKNQQGSTAPVPAATKAPLENPVYINYMGQPSAAAVGTFVLPTAAGRVLDDASASVASATYNVAGRPLTTTDQKARNTYYTYAANNIDLLTIWQGGVYIAQFAGYNALRLPQTYTDAAGKIWSYAYNTRGQVTYVTNPNNETRFWEYDTLGRLTRATLPVAVAFASVTYGATNTTAPTAESYTYDAFDRVRTKTDAGGYVLTYDYDALDRVTKITYPDATFDAYDYKFQSGPKVGTPSLDLRKVTDRLGRVTTYNYDAARRLISVTEPTIGTTTRTTSYAYYPNGALQSQTDAKGNVTRYAIDLQGRTISKTYAHGTAAAKTETTAYETTTSRVKTQTDALGQVKSFTYGADHRVTGVSYTNAVNPTPNVSFVWDFYFPRLYSMTDATGTTTFSYGYGNANGALQLTNIDNGSFANDAVATTYDALGRPSTVTIAGGNEAFTYDTFGRLATHTTGLGVFTYSYLGNTGQVSTRSLNGTAITTSWGYGTNAQDRRLASITHSGVARNYGFSHLIAGGGGASNPYAIQSLTDTAAATHPWLTQTHAFTYDKADRLLTATQTAPGNFVYAYDKLDNATTVTIPGSGTVNPTYNANNQLATSGTKTYAYDANGNTLSGDGAKTYKWDAENRLIEINYVGQAPKKTQFTYDAMNRRIVTTETPQTGSATVTRNLWCGDAVCQTRTAADVVTRRHYTEGEQNVTTGQKLVYRQDQLGSVRDVTDATTGALVAAYDYSPYGSITRTWGTANTDYRYAGLFYHPTSGLNLATYRAMDGTTGRFINRDPIREAGGINLYGYVSSNPINKIDPLGLEDMWVCSRPIDDWYGPILPDHEYVCCSGANKKCYSHARNNLKKGDPIPPERLPNGQCEKRDVTPENKKAHCDAPVSPCDANTIMWNCRDWSNWDGKSPCPGSKDVKDPKKKESPK